MSRVMSVESILGETPTQRWLSSDLGRRSLSDVSTRERLYYAMHPRPESRHHALLQALLAIEVEYRSMEDSEHFENLYWCAFLLHQLGMVEDVISMWRAKHTNFDTGCGFDVQFLVGAGVDATLRYLSSRQDSEAKDALRYLLRCREAGDFDELDEWRSERSAYFNK